MADASNQRHREFERIVVVEITREMLTRSHAAAKDLIVLRRNSGADDELACELEKNLIALFATSFIFVHLPIFNYG